MDAARNQNLWIRLSINNVFQNSKLFQNVLNISLKYLANN